MVDLISEEKSLAKELIDGEKAKEAEVPEPAAVSFVAAPVSVGVDKKVYRSDNNSTTPSLFYVQLEEWHEKMVDDSIVHNELSPIENPHVGQICVAEFDGDWYRGAITALNGSEATVLFVDWGNSETKQVKDVFDASTQPEDVLTSHKLAVPCQLDGVSPLEGETWSKESIDAFNSKTGDDKEFNCKFLSKTGDVFLVDLISRGKSLAKEMVEEGKAKSTLAPAQAESEVEKAEETTATVLFVDWGNSETKELTDVFDASTQPDVVLSPHKLAVPCRLNGVTPLEGDKWSEESIQAFNEKTAEEKEFICKFIAKENGIFLVDLMCDEKSLAKEMIEEGKAKGIEAASAEAILNVTDDGGSEYVDADDGVVIESVSGEVTPVASSDEAAAVDCSNDVPENKANTDLDEDSLEKELEETF